MINSIKPFEKLQFTDDYIFYKVMQNDEICKELLEHLLKLKIDHIERMDVQKELKPFYEAKGIRLDAYVKDSNRIFNIEIQQVADDELPKRSRYYSSMIDADSLLKGKGYTELAESFIVFICSKDPFKLGLPVYTFQNTCQEKKDFFYLTTKPIKSSLMPQPIRSKKMLKSEHFWIILLTENQKII